MIYTSIYIFFIFLQKPYVNIYKPQKIMEKKKSPTLEKGPQRQASVEIIQARKEISSIIIKNNHIYINFYAIFYIFTNIIIIKNMLIYTNPKK